MTSRSLQSERLAWVATVAVLATSLVWLAAIDVVLVATAHGGVLPVARLLLRALLKAVWVLAQHVLTSPALVGWVGALAVAAAIAVLAGRALRSTLGAERGA
jgi:amino acid transporter